MRLAIVATAVLVAVAAWRLHRDARRWQGFLVEDDIDWLAEMRSDR